MQSSQTYIIYNRNTTLHLSRRLRLPSYCLSNNYLVIIRNLWMKIKLFIIIFTGVFFSLKVHQQKNKNILLAPEKQSWFFWKDCKSVKWLKETLAREQKSGEVTNHLDFGFRFKDVFVSCKNVWAYIFFQKHYMSHSIFEKHLR